MFLSLRTLKKKNYWDFSAKVDGPCHELAGFLESQGKPGKSGQGVSGTFFYFSKSQGKSGIIFLNADYCEIKKISGLSSEKCHNYYLILQVKHLVKCLHLSGKFVHKSGKRLAKVRELFRYLVGTLTGVSHIVSRDLQPHKMLYSGNYPK